MRNQLLFSLSTDQPHVNNFRHGSVYLDVGPCRGVPEQEHAAAHAEYARPAVQQFAPGRLCALHRGPHRQVSRLEGCVWWVFNSILPFHDLTVLIVLIMAKMHGCHRSSGICVLCFHLHFGTCVIFNSYVCLMKPYLSIPLAFLFVIFLERCPMLLR